MLNGKRAVVTGSTSGIGLGIARALAAQGAKVMLNGFGEASVLEGLKKEFPAFSAADISKPEQVRALIREATDKLGGVDILVNNAGIQHTAPIESFPAERWDAILAINLSSNFHAIQAALPQMRERNWGRIINVASTHGLVASPQKVAYVAAKHGVVGATKVAAIELANSGVTVNAICPGWGLAPLGQKQLQDRATKDGTTVEYQTHALVAEKQPMVTFTTPEQIGGLAVFLCSDAAATMTGVPLSIDGGWTAQ